MRDDLHMSSRREGDVGLLVVGGEIQVEVACQIQDAGSALLQEGARHLLVNLKAVVFVESASLAALIQLDRELENQQGRIVLCEVSPAVVRVLENSGLKDRFPVTGTEAEGLALLG